MSSDILKASGYTNQFKYLLKSNPNEVRRNKTANNSRCSKAYERITSLGTFLLRRRALSNCLYYFISLEEEKHNGSVLPAGIINGRPKTLVWNLTEPESNVPSTSIEIGDGGHTGDDRHKAFSVITYGSKLCRRQSGYYGISIST